MRKRMAALGLALCLGLSGCAVKGEEKNDSLLGRAAELGEELVLLTVDGREVPAWRYLYWLAFTCDQVREKYKDAGLSLDWETPVPGGTLADYAKDQALANTALYATVENWAEQYGAVLGEADSGALAEAWTEKTASYGGEEQYLAALGNLGLNRARAEALSRVGQLYGKLYELYGADDGPLTPDPADLAAFAREQGWLTVDRALIPIGADRSEAQAKAEEIGYETLSETCGAGAPTLADIVKELSKPGRDPRDELPPPILRTDVMEAKDLKPGMELQGTVRNVIDFGVFVDIGVHQDGLVHISKMPRRVKHPSELLSVGDVVTVWVVEVDEKKKRISLTMKKP